MAVPAIIIPVSSAIKYNPTKHKNDNTGNARLTTIFDCPPYRWQRQSPYLHQPMPSVNQKPQDIALLLPVALIYCDIETYSAVFGRFSKAKSRQVGLF